MPKIVDHAARRAEVTEAALALVASGGRRAASVRALADATGWSVGAVRHYVPSTSALETLLLEHVAARVQVRVAERARDGLDRSLPRVELVAQLAEQILPFDAERLVEHRVWATLWVGPDGADPTAAEHAWAWTGQLLFHRQLILLLSGEPTVPNLPERLEEPDESCARHLQAFTDGLALRLAAGMQRPRSAQADLRDVLAILSEHLSRPR